MTERLWAPWRLEYIQSVDEQPGCFLCNAAGSDDDETPGRRTSVTKYDVAVRATG